MSAMTDAKNEKEEFSLAGKVLMAMPGLADPRFYKAVIFMCAHDENGAMGLIVNHRLPDLTFHELIHKMEMSDEIFDDLQSLVLPVFSGGPVEGGRGFLLHSDDFLDKDTIRVDDHFCVTGTLEALQQMARGQGPKESLFILGYAGWMSGQLEREISDGSWLVSEPDPSIVFHKDIDEKWNMCVSAMGVNPALLSHESGHA